MKKGIRASRLEVVVNAYFSNVNGGLRLQWQNHEVSLLHFMSERPNLADPILKGLRFAIGVALNHCCFERVPTSQFCQVNVELAPCHIDPAFLDELLFVLAV